MKKYIARMLLKASKNDRGVDRPITYDCSTLEEFKKYLKEVKKTFLEKGDDPSLSNCIGNVYSVKFEIY